MVTFVVRTPRAFAVAWTRRGELRRARVVELVVADDPRHLFGGVHAAVTLLTREDVLERREPVRVDDDQGVDGRGVEAIAQAGEPRDE